MLGINRRNLDFVFRDHRPGRFRELDDKLLAKAKLERADLAVPRTLAVLRSLTDRPVLDRVLDHEEEFVLKPARGWGGRGILVLRREGEAWRTPSGRTFDREALHSHAAEILIGGFSLDEAEDAVLVEERIHPDRFFEALYPRGLSDLRVVLEGGEALQAMLRVPTDASDGRANLHEGGLGLGIDLQTGRVIHAVQGERPVTIHPDTGVPLIGAQVPAWQECLELARGVARCYDDFEYLGVDIVHDRRRGPLVLEANARPGLAIQIANRSGQPVQHRAPWGRFDRFTERFAWAMLMGIAFAPMAVRWMAPPADAPEVEIVHAGARQDSPRSLAADRANVEWSDEGIPLSQRDDRFARAKAAQDAGDLEAALVAYEHTLADSSLAPFALNNIALIHRQRGALDIAREKLLQALARYPGYARALYNLGLVERDRGDLQAAETAFRQTLALRPSHANAWGELGELLERRGDLAGAEQAYEQAIRFDPDVVGDRRRLARLLRRSGRPGAAARRFHEALALDPESAPTAVEWVRSRLADAARRERVLAPTALDSMRAVLRRFSDPEHAPPSRRTEFAFLDAWAGDLRTALRRLRSIDAERRSPRAAALLEGLELELGLFDALVAEDRTVSPRVREAARIGRWLEGQPAPAGGNTPLLGPIHDRLGGRVVAASAWRDALATVADSTEAQWLRALRDDAAAPPATPPTIVRLSRFDVDPDRLPLATAFLLDLGRHLVPEPGAWTAALDTLQPQYHPRLRERFEDAVDAGDWNRAHRWGLRALRVRRDDPELRIRLTAVELQRGRTALARTIFERLPPAARSHSDARRVEARLLLAEGDARAARKLLVRLRAEQPGEVETLRWLAEAQAASAKRRSATETLQAALALAPERIDLRESLARLLMTRRHYEEAAEQWRRLLQLPIDERLGRSAWFNLALAELRAGDAAAALSDWDRALALDPGSAAAHFNRGLTLERLDRNEEALAAYRRVLELRPDHEPSRERIAALENQR